MTGVQGAFLAHELVAIYRGWQNDYVKEAMVPDDGGTVPQSHTISPVVHFM